MKQWKKGDLQNKVYGVHFLYPLRYIKVFPETPFSKNIYHLETSQTICKANQSTGFYMIRYLTERYFRTDLDQI